MLPLNVELELYAWMNITTNLLLLLLLPCVLYIGWKKSDVYETWIQRRFAFFLTTILLLWLAISNLVPFAILSFSYPNLTLDIGERILFDFRLAIPLAVVVILIIQILSYKGLFRKSE